MCFNSVVISLNGSLELSSAYCNFQEEYLGAIFQAAAHPIRITFVQTLTLTHKFQMK